MRILHVTREIGSDRRFGIGRSLAPVIDALRERGHEVRYLTQDDQSPRGQAWQRRWTERLGALGRRAAGPSGEVLAAVWLERLNMGRLAAKVARAMQADIVHLHDPWMAWGFRRARLIHRGGAIRWGLSEHGFGCYSDATREEGVPYTPALLGWHRRVEAKVLAAANWVIAPTNAAREQLARDLALPAQPSHWHAIPHARPRLVLPGRATARHALGWSADELHVLAIGRLNPVKRFDALLQACILARRPIHLTILGEGDCGPLQQQLALASGATVTLRVASVDDVAPYLCAADLYVSSTRNESFGLANLEALTAGLPSICTAAGSVPEVTGGSAWLVPACDDGLPGALAEAIRVLIDNPDQRAALGARGARHAQQWPQAESIAQQLEAVYRGESPGHAVRREHGGCASDRSSSARRDEPLCGLPPPLPIAQARRVLVLVPHPDDECIGCGGLLVRLARAAVPTRVVLVTDGAGAGQLPDGADVARYAEFRSALERLGVRDHVWLRLPDGGLAADDVLLRALEEQVRAFDPDWIVAPHPRDLHRDHRAIAEVAGAVQRRIGSAIALWQYETWGTFEPTHVLDISDELATKLDALREHRTALQHGNYVEAAEGLARYRALLLGVARPGSAAEAYVLAAGLEATDVCQGLRAQVVPKHRVEGLSP